MAELKGREKQIVDERIKKIEELRREGIEPYGYEFKLKQKISDLHEKYDGLNPEDKTNDLVVIAGRVMIKRDLGSISFAKIADQYGEIQVVLQRGDSSDEIKNFFKRFVDGGDFIGVNGRIFKTKTGELSVLAEKITILSKAIKPLPEKWHGLQDEEEKYRKRYLDLLVNPYVKKIFTIRHSILKAMREFMEENDFTEIETPLLQPIYGGAAAQPFKTHCNAFDSDVYLSIAPELYLKKALVGGFDRVYEITKKFRNEGVDRSHNPEHMTIEWYQGYADYNDGMKMVEEFMKYLAKKVLGRYTFIYQGHEIDLSKWERLTLEEAIKKYINEDVSLVKTEEQAKEVAKKHGIDSDGITRANLPDELMKTFRDKLIQPTFLTDYPIELAPLAKPKRGDPTKAEIFQPFVGGFELARAYSELNDPSLQAKHFAEQEEERKKGNKEAMETDADFVNALEHAMPPACGVGFGIERIVMLFTNTTSIRDVLTFPFMKPEILKEEKKDGKDNQKENSKKKKKKK
jgi:lysyl-tRNA synthetase, class II